MRDLDTISAALTAAETGHLVITTLHTNNASKTIHRIIDMFPTEQQEQVKSQLASVLIGVLSQKLVQTKDKAGIVLATELLINNPAIGNLIRNDKIHQIFNVMQTSSKEGMYTFENSLSQLASDGYIEYNEKEDNV